MSDYLQTSSIAYFITLCTYGRQLTLGQIKDGQMILSSKGRLVEEEWRRIVATLAEAEIDAFVVMPNHFHAIFWLTSDGSPENIVNSFKSAVIDRTQVINSMDSDRFWQPGSHIQSIRRDKAITSWRRYIENNEPGWSKDPLNPAVGDPSCAVFPSTQ